MDLITHPDYFKSIQSFLTLNDKNNLLLVSKSVYKNLEYCEPSYQEKRIKWRKLIQEFKLFKQTLISNVNRYKKQDKFFKVFVFDYWDGPLEGLGVYGDHFCYFKNRQEIIKQEYKGLVDKFANGDCDENILDLEESVMDWTFQISILQEPHLEKILMALFLMKEEMKHWFTKKSGFYQTYKAGTFSKEYKLYKNYIQKKRTEIKNLPANFSILYKL